MNDIQSRLQACHGTLSLPQGEYEGPLVIDRPCELTADNAVLWAKKGPVLRVEAEPVTIRGLRVEVTGPDALPPDGIAVRTQVRNVTLEGVEVRGGLSGFAGESSAWDLPDAISLGAFAAERKNVFTFELDAPTPARLSADRPFVRVTPERLAAGVHTVRVELGPMPNGATLNASLFVTTAVTRRVALTGYAVRKAPLRRAASPMPPPYVPDPEQPLEIVCEDASDGFPPDSADGYAFLLGADGQTHADEDLIFFGQPESVSGDAYERRRGVWPSIWFRLSNAAERTERIAVCFAVDDRTPDLTFQEPCVRVFVGDEEVRRVELPDCRGERILIAAELRRDGDAWRMEPVGTGYRNDLTALCRSYGVDAEFDAS